jgi:DNA-directed RNA polymerase subunit RPC12/RpoP
MRFHDDNFITFEPDPGTTRLDKSIACPKCGHDALMMGKPGERIVNVDTRLKEAS